MVGNLTRLTLVGSVVGGALDRVAGLRVLLHVFDEIHVDLGRVECVSFWRGVLLGLWRLGGG